MLGNRAERTAAKAAAHNVHREADHLISRNAFGAVSRVRHALVRQRKDAVHLFGRERDRRRVDPDITIAMLLHQRAGAAGVGFVVQNARGVRVEHFIALHFFIRRQQHVGFLPRLRARWLNVNGFRHRFFRFVAVSTRQIVAIRMWDRIDAPRRVETRGIHTRPARQRFFHHDRRTTHIADRRNGLTHRQTVRHFHQRTLAIAENQHVGFGIHQHRAAHGIRPVIVMRGAAQARLNTAQNHRHVAPGLFTALGIDQGCAIRAFPGFVIRRVGVVMAQFAIRCVAVDHRIHVPGGDAEKQVRSAKAHKVVFAAPVRLRDDPDAKALRLQHTAANRHAEARVIDVGVAGDENNIAAVPAELVHLLARHR
ncbi:hypothetical protein BN130_3373 [Cronobacter malonaticus 507]|nr:hypothetical protein BN130_3373 [Cronobacter malonaticus 507]